MDQESSKGSLSSFVSADFDEPETDVNAWKEYESCNCCNCRFGFAETKFVCRFCYRGVCKECSDNRMPHNRVLELQRTCDHCYKAQSGTEQKQTKPESLSVTEESKERRLQQGEEMQKHNEENVYQEKSHSELLVNREELIEEILNLRRKLSVVETEHHLHNKQLLKALEVLKKQVYGEQQTNQELNEQIQRECKEGNSQGDSQKLKQLEHELNTTRQALERLRAKPQEESVAEPATEHCKCFVF